MSLFFLSLLFSAFASSVVARPLARQDANTTCTNPAVRVDWETLNDGQKSTYFEAVNCLKNTPSKLNKNNAQSLYDDLVVVHQTQADTGAGTDSWHFVGQFLHVHRYYLHLYETVLRDECGYTGPMVYWNEERDAGNYEGSVTIQDFGGFGSQQSNWQITEGPFSNWTYHVGPGSNNYDHPFTRAVNERQARTSGSWYVDGVNKQTAFADFKDLLYDTLHVAGHNGLGGGRGDISNVLSSPNDPTFFLHHGYLDYLWYNWQGSDESRINDLDGAGNETQKGTNPTTPETELYMYDLIATATVADVARTTGGLLCYTYE